MWGHGLKQVRNRRDDALSRVRWDRLESLLAEYYAGQGYRVEHVGTGGTGQRFDGGIDLKLWKDDQYVLVQCKGWNAYQVPHNEVHQLIGLVVNEGATGAILVTSGEFTRSAIEAATRHGHVQLVDGEDLRGMLGPLPEPDEPPFAQDSAGVWSRPAASTAQRVVASVDDHLLSAAEDRIRYGSRGRRGGGGLVVDVVVSKLIGGAISLLLFLLLFWFVSSIIKNTLSSVTTSASSRSKLPAAMQANPSAAPRPASLSPSGAVSPRMDRGAPVPAAPSHQMRQYTPEEIRELEKKAEEAMKVIETTTPEV